MHQLAPVVGVKLLIVFSGNQCDSDRVAPAESVRAARGTVMTVRRSRPCIDRALPVLFLFSFAVLSAHAQVYKWTDKDGKSHYGDRPPADAKTSKVAINVTSFGGPATVDYVSILRRPVKGAASAPAEARVTIYTASWCGPCKSAKAWMNTNGISYTEYDVETTETGKRDYQEMKMRGVPTILVGNQRMTGFSSRTLQAMIKQGG